jgi:glycerol-3-phosphate dehydrogenase subunit C
MTEGSLEAPVRHPIDWHNPDFYDEEKLDAELRRVFDICHGCRRCFNLCDSFPKLFDLIDEGETGELDAVKSEDFKPVVDACTLCDMCFMTKCPYVPPHEFNLDFPHLMLRYRAVEARKGKTGFAQKQLSETDRNGRLAAPVAGLANWATKEGNGLTRPLMQAVAGIDAKAALPRFHGKTFAARAKSARPAVNRDAPAFGRKAPPASSTTTIPASARPPRACWPGTASKPRLSTRAAAACRSWSRATLPPWRRTRRPWRGK